MTDPLRTPTARAAVTAWLKDRRGSESQESLASRITATTGWRITRDRYSKYESGRIGVGRDVLAHFAEFWGEWPDLSKPPEPTEPPSLEERAVLAAERQAAALEALAAYLMRQPLPDPALVAAAQAWAESVDRPSLPRQSDPLVGRG